MTDFYGKLPEYDKIQNRIRNLTAKYNQITSTSH